MYSRNKHQTPVITKKMDGAFEGNRFLVRDITTRRDWLAKIIEEKERALEMAPEGTLRILKRKGYNQYYWRKDAKDTNGTYINKGEIELANRLAQKDYDEKVLKQAKKELALLRDYLKVSVLQPEEVYDLFNNDRKKLISPIEIDDDIFVKEWMNEAYELMPIAEDVGSFYSNNGVRVRSKSEALIANMLEHFRVPYKYEYPLKLDGLGMVRPDFVCLNVARRKEIVWEHFGMMDNVAYANKNIQKLGIYEQNGFLAGDNMIMTFETSQCPLNSNVVRMKIENMLVE